MSVLGQLLGRTTAPPIAAPQTVPGTDTPMPPWAAQLIAQNQVSPQVAQGDGTGIPPWVDMTALKNAAGDSPYEVPEADTGTPTPWGFVGNLIGDVPQLVGGFASLLGMGAGDIWNLGREGLEKVGLAEDQDKGFYTDDILKGLLFDPAKAAEGGLWKGVAPVIQEDLGHRYGGLSNLAEGLYNDPLFYLADAFSAGELGGAAMVKSAKSALPRVADELADLGSIEKELMTLRKAGTDDAALEALKATYDERLARLSPEAARVKKTLPGAGMGKFDPVQMEKLGLPESIPIAGYRATLDNVTGGRPTGRYLQNDANPFRRSMKSGLRKLGERPLSALETRRAEFMQDIEGGTTSQGLAPDKEFGLGSTDPSTVGMKSRLVEVDRLGQVIKEANKYGLSSVARPAVDRFKMRKAVQTQLSDFVTAFYGNRNKAHGRLAEAMSNHFEEAIRLKRPNASPKEIRDLIDKTFMPRLNQILQLDTPVGLRKLDEGNLDQLRPEGTPEMVRAAHDLMQQINDIVMTRGGTLMRERMAIEVSNYQEARALIDQVNRQMPPGSVVASVMPDEALGNIGQIILQTPTGKVKLRIVDRAANEVLEATDHLFKMEAKLLEVFNEPGVLEWVGDVAQLSKKEELEKIIQVQRQALLKTVADQSEHMLAAMDGAIGKFTEPMARLHAQLRTITYSEMTRIALDEGKMHARIMNGFDIPDFLAIRNRAFMPAHLERVAMAPENIQAVVKSLRDRAKKGEDINKLVEELGAELGPDTGSLLEKFVKRQGSKDWLADELNNTGYDTMGIVSRIDLLDELEGAYAQAGRSTPVYFPHMDVELGTPSDYLMKKKLVGGHQQRNASRFKEFAGWLYVNNRWETNPLEVFARASSQIRQYQSMGEFYQKLIDFGGRKIRRIDEYNPESEALLAPDLFNKMMASRMEVEMGFMKAKLTGTDDFEAMLSAMTQFQKKLDRRDAGGVTDAEMETLFSKIHELLGPTEQADMVINEIRQGAQPGAVVDELTGSPRTHAGDLVEGRSVELYAVPKVMADQIDAMAKMQFGWKTRIFWDGPVNLWKAAVLSYSPRWIFYNLLGNMTFLKMQGGSLADAGRILFGKLGHSKKMNAMFGEGAFTSKFLKVHEEMLQRAAVEAPGFMHRLRGGFFSDVNQNVTHIGEGADTAMGKLMTATKSRPGAQRLSRGAARMRHLNELIEESFREAAFVTALERQAAATGVKNVGKSFIRSSDTLENLMKNGMDDATVGRALEEVDYFLNNYARLSPIERNVVKRFLMPFYSFYKHVVKLSVTYPFEHPLRASVIRSMGELARDMATEFGAMPDWLVGSVPIGEGESEGETRFLNTRGLNPFNALQNPLESLGTSITPQLKMFYEQATGQSMLTGKPFSHPDVVTPFGTSQQFRINPETGNVDPTTVRPNIFYQLAQQFPQFKLFQDIASSVAGPGAGARYTATGEVITDEDGNPLYPDDLLVNIASLGGISQTDFQLSKFQEQQASGERLALIEWLKRNGYLEDEPMGDPV